MLAFTVIQSEEPVLLPPQSLSPFSSWYIVICTQTGLRFWWGLLYKLMQLLRERELLKIRKRRDWDLFIFWWHIFTLLKWFTKSDDLNVPLPALHSEQVWFCLCSPVAGLAARTLLLLSWLQRIFEKTSPRGLC